MLGVEWPRASVLEALVPGQRSRSTVNYCVRVCECVCPGAVCAPGDPHVRALSFLDQEVPKTVLHFGSIPAAVVMERSRTHALAVPIDSVCANDDKQTLEAHVLAHLCI